MQSILELIFLSRASLDVVLEYIKLPAGLSGGAPVNVLVLLVCVVLIIIRRRTVAPIVIWLPFLSSSLISISYADDKILAVRAFVVLVMYCVVFVAPFYMPSVSIRDGRLLMATLYSSLFPVFYGILEAAFFLDNTGRVKSTFLHPNVFSFYLNIVFGLILFIFSSRDVFMSRKERVLLLLLASLIFILSILTQSRSGWLGLGLILVGYSLLVNRKLLLYSPMLFLLIFVPAVSDRLADLATGADSSGSVGIEGINSFAWRTLMWRSALSDGQADLVFGSGLASFGKNALKFFPLVDSSIDYGDKGIGAHNVYVQLIYEIGYVGMLAYVGLLISVAYRALNFVRRDFGGVIVYLLVLISYCVESYSDNMMDYGGLNFYFWGFLGAAASRWLYMPPLACAGNVKPSRA